MSGNLIDLRNSKKKFQILNKSESVSEILLYGPIGDYPWEDSAVSAKQFADELKKLPSSIKEIHLRVNSPGGSVFDGMAMYEQLKSQKSKQGRKIVCYVDGVAASIASIIILAADEIIVGDASFIMIHKPLVMTYGNSNDHERNIEILDRIEDQMISIYARKTGMSRVEIAAALSKETWYTSAEALEVGLADSQFEAKDALQLVASAIKDCNWMRNKPVMKSQDDLVRAKLREFSATAKEYLNKK